MARKPKRCTEIVARTPSVLLEGEVTRGDYTHLQYCGAPVVKDHRCRRHLDKPITGLDRRWRRFLLRGA